MEEQDKKPASINMKRVAELESVLRRQMTFKSRFRFNMSADDAVTLLTAFYKIEVESRLRQFKFDANTQKSLLQLAEYITSEAPHYAVGNVRQRQDDAYVRFPTSVESSCRTETLLIYGRVFQASYANCSRLRDCRPRPRRRGI